MVRNNKKRKNNSPSKKPNQKLTEAIQSEVTGQNTHHTIHQWQQTTIFSSPLPPARELKELDDIVPGLANRLVHYIESEQKHRHQIEKQIVEQEIANHQHVNKERTRGQWFAFFITLIAILTTAWLAANDKDASAIVSGLIAMAALTASFFSRVKPTSSQQDKQAPDLP